MLSKSTMHDVIRVSTGIYLCGIAMLLCFALVGKFGLDIILGALLGCTFTCLSFLFLAFSLEKSISKGQNTARVRIGAGYTIRLIAAAAMILWAIRAPYFNHWAAIIPLFFQRLVVTLLSVHDNRKGGRSNEC